MSKPLTRHSPAFKSPAAITGKLSGPCQKVDSNSPNERLTIQACSLGIAAQ
jgi:hypothetical protein